MVLPVFRMAEPMSILQPIIHTINSITEWTGRIFSWLSLLMVLLMFLNVVQRYLFHTGAIWQQELVGYFHAILFMAAAGYTLKHDKHVRVDVLYHRFSDQAKAIVNLLGTFVFMIPVCVCIIVLSNEFIIASWDLKEASSEYNGMPGVFILKSFIWVFAGSLLLQSVSIVAQSWLTLTHSGEAS